VGWLYIYLLVVTIFAAVGVLMIYTGIRELRYGPPPLDPGAPEFIERIYRRASPSGAVFCIVWGVLAVGAMLYTVIRVLNELALGL